MARIGGRNSWIAVPAGLLCAAVVGALAWLSVPMIPVTFAWVGDTLRQATAAPAEVVPEQTPAQLAAAGGAIDCRALYPDDLWMQMLWSPGALLNQSDAPPATTATAFADAAAAEVLVTCAWRSDNGVIVTTLAKVDAAIVAIAEPSLAGDGFSCTSADGGVECTRTQGAVREEHTLRDGLWLVSVETDWQPEDYGRRVGVAVWG